MGRVEAASSWKIVKPVFRKQNPKKRIRSYRATALTAVMFDRYASCVILRLEKEKEPESWRLFHVGGIDGISW